MQLTGDKTHWLRELCKVFVRIRGVRISLEVLAVDESFDAPLNDLGIRFEEG